MMHESTIGSFLFEGTRRDHGHLQEVSGLLNWNAVPMADDNGERVVSVKMRVRIDDDSELEFDPIPPEAFKESAVAVVERGFVPRLGRDDMDAQNELIRRIGANDRGFDIRADGSVPFCRIKGAIPFAGIWDRPGAELPERIAGKILWDAMEVEDNPRMRKVRAIPEAAFDLGGAPTGMETLECEFVGMLADGDWRAQSDFVSMMGWDRQGFRAHVLPV